MAHTSSIYDSIRELDEAERGDRDVVPEMSITSYMMPPQFKGVDNPVKMEHIRNIMVNNPKAANSSNRIRVKNTYTGVSFEFSKMVNAARFVGTTGANVRCGIMYEVARVYRIDGEEYVFVYDDKERPMEESSSDLSFDNGLVEVVSSTGERTPFYSYLSVAKHLGLLVGHILEEEKRARKREYAKRYIIGKKEYTIEFDGERRKECLGKGIRCYWKGIYDREGDWGKIHCINVTR